ncbi:MAG: fatty acid desaturase family protein [Myxococcales bacterium]|nr:fatty acid desaturase family protein [Myxococcales bacterium]
MADTFEHRSAQELAAGYKMSHRVAEIIAMVTYATLAGIMYYHLVPVAGTRPITFVIGALAGYFAADFVSGFVHWFCDTWGSVEWPVVGPVFIRTFREHHVDPDSITRHDFVETNGASCMAVLPAVLPGALFRPDPSSTLQVLLAGAIATFCALIPFTTQTHKWAHMKIDEVSLLGRFLIKSGILLNHDEHDRHHHAPFTVGYCITSGRCNKLLDRVGFWRIAERVITRVTGAIPREDDIGRRAAERIAAE